MFGLTPYRKNNSLGRRPEDGFDGEKFFGELVGESVFPFIFGSNQMKVDVKENEKEYVIEAELPGIKKEEVVVDLKDDMLIISVERKEQTNEEKENYIRRERRYGTMSRAFGVSDIMREGVSAKFENGILTVVLPKGGQSSDKNTRINID